MCGAYGFSVKDAREVYTRFDIANTLENLNPRWNVRPGQMNPVIVYQEQREITRMFWGLIPFFAKDRSFAYKTINARAETVATLSSYRKPLRRQRCIIPATGFYEPDKINFSKPPYPWHYFQVRDQKLFSFAGLYDIWKDRESGNEIHSYTLITTEPNSLVGKYHDRMPVILDKEGEEEWLNPDTVEPERLHHLLRPYEASQMEEWEVSGDARNPKNDYPEVMEPMKENEQGKLLN